MIEDANKQKPKRETKGTAKRPLPQLYYYGYGQANLPSIAEETKDFIIQTISFPKSYNLLENLRHGTWAGYTQGFDPVDLAKSSSGDQSGDLPLALDEYAIRRNWKDMSHVNPKGKPPFDMSKLAPQGEPSMVDTPRRVRLKPVMTRGYGNMEKKESKQSAPIGGQSVKSIVEAGSYNFLRLKSLLYQQLQVTVPGNLDLMAGHGIHITIPKALPDKPNSTNIPTDQRWSGLWIIASAEHKYHDGRMISILLLTRDSTPDSGGASSKNNESTSTIAGNSSGRRRRKGRVRKKRRGLRRRGAMPAVGSGLGSRKKRRRKSKKRGKNVSNPERRQRRNKKRSTAGRRAIKRNDTTARRKNRGGRQGSGGTRTKKRNNKTNKRRNRRRKNKNR